MLRIHRPGRGPGGWGLGSTQQEGRRSASGLGGWRTRSGTGFLGPSGWGKCLWHFPRSPGPGVSPLSASLSLPPSSIPLMPLGRMWPRGGLGEWRTSPGSPAGFPGCKWVGETPSVPPLILQSQRFPPPVASPLLPLPPSHAPRTHVAQRGPQRVKDLA